ncbi:WecB/TagA/CpsF family glycosyltransferase [Bradyrhizobium sp.]|uniref:WecB/TagA/CpsF family glycosyltransferase n=1 Tax=Bradyrhizobium sp. TaxID=376 RepID=UPI0039E30CBE
MISTHELLLLFERWIVAGQQHYVVFRDVHGVVAARDNEKLDSAHKHADIIAPDGMPLVWALRAAGVPASRVCGPDTLLATCEYGLSRGWKHYFYGGEPGVADQLVEKLTLKYPSLRVAGTQCPPFRELTAQEDERICAEIRDAQPDLIWVCLGTPKQEIWMSEHQGKCGHAIMLGVGAAFNFHAHLVKRAPQWMQRMGLEWAFRLLSEPKRLWKRYLLMAPVFATLAAREVLQRRFSSSSQT